MTMASASTPLRIPAPLEEESDEIRLAQLRADIKAGDDQLIRGETLDEDEAWAQIRERFKARHGHYPDQE